MSNPIPQQVVVVPTLATFQSTNVSAYANGGAQLAYLQGTMTELDGGEAFYQRIDGDFSSASNPPDLIVDGARNRWQKTTSVFTIPVSVPNGGTGRTALLSGSILLGDGASPITELSPGAGVTAWMTTPSSANLRTAMTDETGTGVLVFATSPTLVTPLLGTPTSGNLANCTGYPAGGLSGLGTGVATWLATPSSANLAAAVTDETGTGALVFANTPTLVTPVLGAASATSLTFSSTSGIIGTTTNNNAAAGSVGEIVSSTVASGSAVSLTTDTVANVTTISLTAGDWDVWGNVWFPSNAATVITGVSAGVTSTSATFPTTPDGAYAQHRGTLGTGQFQALPTGTTRVSIAVTTTIYLCAAASFSVNTMSAYGYLGARRVR